MAEDEKESADDERLRRRFRELRSRLGDDILVRLGEFPRDMFVEMVDTEELDSERERALSFSELDCRPRSASILASCSSATPVLEQLAIRKK